MKLAATSHNPALIVTAMLLLLGYSSYSQGKIITLGMNEKVYNTSNLNVNGVAVKSVILLADSTTLAQALRGKRINGTLDQATRSDQLRNWMAKYCGEILLIHPNETIPALKKKLGVSYQPNFEVHPGKIYIVVKIAQDFVSVFQSFTQREIPPPILPPNDPPFKYKYEPFCEIDACIPLCVNKKEASFEVCCNGYCFTISFDGELNLTASTQLK